MLHRYCYGTDGAAWTERQAGLRGDATLETPNQGRPAGPRTRPTGINRETPSGLVRKWQDMVGGNGGGVEAVNHPSVAWARRQGSTLPGSAGSGCANPARLRAW